MRALITGGAGFIGSHLADRLVNDGHTVTVLDDFSTGSMENIAHLQKNRLFSCVNGSVLDEKLVHRAMESADVVFHLAAAVGVKLVVGARVHTIETNVRGTEIVLHYASRGRRPVLITSTSEVYGKATVFPFREDADVVLGASTKGRWGYAASKLIDEFLALAYYHERGLPVTVVRLFNTVGPRQNSRYGMVIPTFVCQALTGAPLTVHGDGSQTRSFTWIGDVVGALADLIVEPKARGEVFNVGNGAEVSILDLARLVKRLTNSSSPIRFESYDQAFDETFEDMPRRVPDIDKLRRAIGYAPAVQLEEMVRRIIGYWSTRLQPASTRASSEYASHMRLVSSKWPRFAAVASTL
jgi:nucleoside-diphosphate-sugar epimerase